MTKQLQTIEPQAEVPTLPADSMVSMIERVVTDPDADLDKLERMLAMKERMDADAARREFSEALAACQAEMEPVARNKRNTQTNSNYSDLAAIYKGCKPVAGRHGFSFSVFPAPSEKDGHMGVRWTLRHSGGHEQGDLAEIPLDSTGIKGNVNKTKTHAFGSTVSYARRYLFCMIFDIATSDDNDGQSTGEALSEEQFRELQDLAERAGVAEDVICQAAKVSALHDLPAAQFASVKSKLEKNLAQRAAD